MMSITDVLRETQKIYEETGVVMSYGEYVEKYDPPKPPTPPKAPEPNHICPTCGKAFYAKNKTRVYCDDCRDEVARARSREYDRKRAQKRRRAQQEG